MTPRQVLWLLVLAGCPKDPVETDTPDDTEDTDVVVETDIASIVVELDPEYFCGFDVDCYELYVNTARPMVATAYDADGARVETTFTWSTSDESIATINA